MAWLESLLDLLNSHLLMQEDHDNLKAKYMLEADSIFDEIDTRGQDWISHSAFKRWVATNCGYMLVDNDLLILQPILDDSRDGQITRDEFIACFGPPVDDVEALDHVGAEAEFNKQKAAEELKQKAAAEDLKQKQQADQMPAAK